MSSGTPVNTTQINPDIISSLGGLGGLKGYANGGRMTPNSLAVVGENGPELVTTGPSPLQVFSNQQSQQAVQQIHRRKVEFWLNTDSLVHQTDTQTIIGVFQVINAGKKIHDVTTLGIFQPLKRIGIAYQRCNIGVTGLNAVERLHDVIQPAFHMGAAL